MYDQDAPGEVGDFNIHSSANQTCLTDDCSAPPCGSCYTCTLELRLVSTRQWFPRAGDLSKRHFVIGLVRRIDSLDLLRQLDRLLQATLGKDFTHSRASINPSLDEDLSTLGSDRALSKVALHKYIFGTWQWFADSGYWTKTNYVLGLLQMCDVKLLHVVGNLIRTLLLSAKIPEPLQATGVDLDDDVISLTESHYTFKSEEHPELQQLAEIWPQYPVVSLSTLPKGLLVQPADHSGENLKVASSISSLRSERKLATKKKEKVLKNITAEVEPPIPIIITSPFMATSGVSNHKDFLRCLPIHLAKYILGFLDNTSLNSCMSLSRHWRYLAKEMIRDKLALQCIFDEVEKIQEKGNRTRMQTVEHIKKEMKQKSHEAKRKETIRKKKGKGKETTLETCIRQLENKDIQIIKKKDQKRRDTKVVQVRAPANANITYARICNIAVPKVDEKGFTIPEQSFRRKFGLGTAYIGIYTDVIQMEEKNVYCGPYNIIVIKQRRWNLTSGLCMNIYRGHTRVITGLELHEDMFVSAGMDCHAKVWNLAKTKCICSFKHDKPVLSVAISEMSVVSSCAKGLVHVWSIEPPSIVKILTGHSGPVTCVSFDQWHLASGSKDNTIMVWSMIGKFSESLLTFRHPQEVLCLHLCYLRVISGCNDGKIRIFDLCSSNCLRVMRGNSRSDPVLSLHLAGRRIVINTVSNVVLLFFEKIKWDYTASSAINESSISKDKFKMAPLRKQPYSYVRAQRMRRIGSTNEKIYHREEPVAEQGLSHHAPFMSARCMQAAQRIQSDSMKILNLREFQNASLSDLQSELPSKPSSTGWVSRSPKMFRHESLRQEAQTRFGYGKRTESLSQASRLLSASEQSTLKHIKKHMLYRPRTPDQIYLTVNAIHNTFRFDATNINTLYNNSLAEDWGRLLCPLEDTRKRLAERAKKKHRGKISIIDAIQPTDDCVDVKKLIAPFLLKEKIINQKSVFHSINTKCFATKPKIKRSKSTLGFIDPVQFNRQKNRPQTALEDVAKTMTHITTGSKESKPDKSFMITSSVSSLTGAKLKPQQILNMDPYRNNTSFSLKTVKQQKEYADRVVMEHNLNQQRKEQEKDRASRKAWLKKAEVTELGSYLHK
uniref:F-box and WD repeat domain containing protein 10B isoform X2 n=1 Tax=Pristiophorus japonicus TaxID=55135 RepID=UPI00398E39CE